MNDLLRAEARRLWYRRVPRIGVAVVAAAMAISAVVQFAQADFAYATSIVDATRALSVQLLTFAGIVIGASFVGADWNSRTMENLLTWEPRRDRVLVAKLAVAFAGGFVAGLVVLVALAVLHLPAGARAGTLPDAGGVARLVTAWLRGAALGAFGGIVGASVAMVVRNTAGVVAGWFVYITIVDPILMLLSGGTLQPWLVGANLSGAVGVGGFNLPGPGSPGGLHAAVMLSAYVALLAVAARAALRARDVT